LNDYFRRKEAVGARDGKMAEKLVKAAETWQKSIEKPCHTQVATTEIQRSHSAGSDLTLQINTK
jgi:hypothetical protein